MCLFDKGLDTSSFIECLVTKLTTEDEEIPANK